MPLRDSPLLQLYVCSINRNVLLHYTGNTQKNGAVSRVDKELISHPTRA
jgi:hypothetical protein